MIRALGIESSCDETAAAVVVDGTEVLSNALHSQIALHERHRGVVPEIASRSHTTRILPIVEAALDDAGVTPEQLDLIAVTNRPGMVGCLLVGLSAAKTLAWMFGKPLVGVDHVQAHLHAAFMTRPDLPTPGLSLVASGGHTALYRLDAPGETSLLGRTRDDAAGEALDKGAAVLGLPYPGGPSIEAAAANGDPKAIRLPRTMLDRESLDFSFSGVKTALLYHLRGPGLERPAPELDAAAVADIAASYQRAIVETLVRKMRRAAERESVRSLSIGGGVARNKLLREMIGADPVLSRLELVFPPMDLCSDNGAMIAGLGTHLWQSGHRDGLDLDAIATARTRRA
ncbi:MAG: tRNA (adenosine(37)-N6)-threonylcarbamoyltransferase complex transferase subunit TsaD [Planctomycetes bacterium]|nr:tRNA (adenosine(37)-N6)-threonylcarbamoyltransferase complex transferase subunit TsaD [Planctomycetota bacterium]